MGSFTFTSTRLIQLVPLAPMDEEFAITSVSTRDWLIYSWEPSQNVRYFLAVPSISNSLLTSCFCDAAFGAAGGYIAGSHELVSSLRVSSHAQSYAEAMPPPVLSQIITSMASLLGPESLNYVPSLASLPKNVIAGPEGKDRLRRLAFNCRYLSGFLKKMGFIVY